jgi:pSer/pThr/pTyr-binding forkhead associated (FHA) protein
MYEKPVLVASEGQLLGQRWAVEANPFIIGRGSECHLILPERQVSRQHAIVTQEGGKYTLHDLDSKNGTHLNGRQVKGQVPLNDGDEIQIALAVKLVFVGSDATLPLNFELSLPAEKLVLDPEQRSVIINGVTLSPPLSLAQFRLLEMLYTLHGAVCDRDAIVEAVWPGTGGEGVSEQAIDALVRRLRDRLAELDDHNFIVTVRGHGFRLDNLPA